MSDKSPVAKGLWQDTIEYTDGRVIVGDWHSNQIQTSHATLIAMLMKDTIVHTPPTVGGISYVAVGEGLASWDLVAPTKPYDATTLSTEVARYAVDQTTNIVYLDPADGVSIVAGPTRMLQINLTIPLGLTGDLREFGVFGGDASSSANSGYMLNWISHNKIVKTTDMRIHRVLKIKWLSVEEMLAL